LFAQFDRMAEGLIAKIEVAHGLPLIVEILEQPAA
jgi:hypothetical protein